MNLRTSKESLQKIQQLGHLRLQRLRLLEQESIAKPADASAHLRLFNAAKELGEEAVQIGTSQPLSIFLIYSHWLTFLTTCHLSITCFVPWRAYFQQFQPPSNGLQRFIPKMTPLWIHSAREWLGLLSTMIPALRVVCEYCLIRGRLISLRAETNMHHWSGRF